MRTLFPFSATVSRLGFVLRVVAFVIITALVDPRGGEPALMLFIILAVAVFAAFAGRLRDAGFSPWLALVLFVPVIGWLVAVVFMVWNGRR